MLQREDVEFNLEMREDMMKNQFEVAEKEAKTLFEGFLVGSL